MSCTTHCICKNTRLHLFLKTLLTPGLFDPDVRLSEVVSWSLLWATHGLRANGPQCTVGVLARTHWGAPMPSKDGVGGRAPTPFVVVRVVKSCGLRVCVSCSFGCGNALRILTKHMCGVLQVFVHQEPGSLLFHQIAKSLGNF